MARGASQVLGLDIGNESIKLVELALAKNGVRLVTEPVVVPTPSGALAGGVIVDPEAVTAALRDALGGKRFHSHQVVLSVGGDTSTVTRVISMPRMTGKELDEAMQWELDRQTPFPVDQVIYDYAPLPARDEAAPGETMDVFLAVGQEDMINDHIRTLRGAKLLPLYIDVEPLALGRALVGLPGDKYMEGSVVLLDCGATFTGIYIFRRGWPAFLRTIPIAGEQLTEAIREHLEIDREQAEQAKRLFGDVGAMAYEGPPPADSEEYESSGALAHDDGEYGDIYEESSGSAPLPDVPTPSALETIPATELDVEIAAPTQAPAPPPPAPLAAPAPLASLPPEVNLAREHVAEALSQRMFDLVTEISRSLDFYRRQARGERLVEMILCGGSAHLQGLAGLLGAETGIPTSVANPYQYLINEGVASEEYLRDLGPQTAVAVGLALRDMID